MLPTIRSAALAAAVILLAALPAGAVGEEGGAAAVAPAPAASKPAAPAAAPAGKPAPKPSAKPAAAKPAARPGPAKPAVKAPPPAARPIVKGVHVEGFKRVDESAIRIHITHPVGVELDETATDLDVKAIYRMGFFENVWVTTEPSPGGVTLVYHVQERPYVGKVEYEGNDHVEKADLEAVIGIRPRTVFDPQKAWEGLREAKKVYAGKGYPDAEIHYDLVTQPDGTVTVHYGIDEKKKVLIKDVQFEGVHEFTHAKLRRVMTSRRKWILSWFTGSGILKEEELRTDVDRLTALYYDSGYIQVRVDDIDVTRKDDDLFLTVRIEEGAQYRVGKVHFEGEVLEDQAKLIKASGLNTGEIFKPSRLRESIFNVTEAYGDLGRAFAEAIPLTDVHEDSKTVDIGFKMTAGPVVSVNRIEVRGNTKTRDEVVRRELRQQEGQQFSGKGLRQGTARVKRLGIFDDVKVESTKTDKPDQVNLAVDVKEGRTGTFSAGAGFSSEDALLANARITERNLFGRDQTATANVDFGSRRRNYRLGFEEPWAFDIPLSLGIDAFNWSYEFSDFRRGGTGMSLRASYPLWELGLRSLLGASLDDIRAGVEYRLENTVIDGVSIHAPPSVTIEEGTKLTSSIRPSIVRNTIDQPFDPTEGSINTISGEFAGLGGENKFTKGDVTSRWYFPVYKSEAGWKLVYSVAGSFGWGWGNGGTSGEELPLSERYFPGGINTVRGFETRTLGPRESWCDPTDGQGGPGTQGGNKCISSAIGGSSQLILNNEIIFPIIPDAGVKGVVFFDAGNAWSNNSGIDLGELRLAAGLGLRWLSPFGPLRIEIGFPLNSKSNDQTQLVLFSFGTPY
ncbi:MAG TPA: outer membrane protein assembly factor BamA [Candidatus Binatia bacterium]|jgi:outer membrane protein insertion porin family